MLTTKKFMKKSGVKLALRQWQHWILYRRGDFLILDRRRNEHVRVKIMYSLEECVFLVATYFLTNRNLNATCMEFGKSWQQRVLFNVSLRSLRRLEACMMTREGRWDWNEVRVHWKQSSAHGRFWMNPPPRAFAVSYKKLVYQSLVYTV